MAEHEAPAAQGRVRLCDFIREHRPRILESWVREVRRLPVLRDFSHPRLIDHLPAFLDRVAGVVETVRTEEERTLEGIPEEHALERLHVEQVAQEYAVLRACVLELYGEHLAGVGPWDAGGMMREVVCFNRTFDEAVTAAVSHYARARERTLVALDRISEAALGTEDLDAFLPKLLRVMLETTEAVDSVTLLLREGELLRVRAAGGAGGAGALRGIFEPFRRAVRGDAHPTSGLGLGLFIVQEIARAHGGTVEVCSREGQGTTFTVRLPRHAPPTPSPEMAPH